MICQELLTQDIPYARFRREKDVAELIYSGVLPEAPDFDKFNNSAVVRALWSFALKCWNEDPDLRPLSTDAVNEIGEL